MITKQKNTKKILFQLNRMGHSETNHILLRMLLTPEYTKVDLVEDDIEGSREERAFRLWVNSLGIEGIYIDDLYDGISDGWTLCKVVDKV